MSKEREKFILEKLLKQKRITVKEASQELFVSESSLRRDLASLERQNLIKRVHGGAVIEETAMSRHKIPFLVREMEQSASKITIAGKAAKLVKDNDVVFLDASTTAYCIIPFLAEKINITVITNGVKALSKLAEYEINTISTGGRLIPSCFALVGEEAYKTIESVNADITFFSCRGISDNGTLTDISAEENYIRQRMIKNSEKSFLVCTSDKIGKMYYHNLCDESDIDGVITENDLLRHSQPL